MRAWWLPIPASLLVGICVAIPLFLLARDRSQRRLTTAAAESSDYHSLIGTRSSCRRSRTATTLLTKPRRPTAGAPAGRFAVGASALHRRALRSPANAPLRRHCASLAVARDGPPLCGFRASAAGSAVAASSGAASAPEPARSASERHRGSRRAFEFCGCRARRPCIHENALLRSGGVADPAPATE